MHILSTFGIIVLVQLLSLRGDADLASFLLSAPVAVSACKVVTSDSGLCNLVTWTDTGNVADCTGFHGASVSAEHKRRRDDLKRCVVQFFGSCANDGLAAAIVISTESFGATLSAALPPWSTYHAVIEDAR